jgi:uncharacterized DUF497 family protein
MRCKSAASHSFSESPEPAFSWFFLSQQPISIGVVSKRHTMEYNQKMKYFVWSTEKNERLKSGRHISFEEIVFYIESGQLLDIVEHPNVEKYKGQRIFIVNVDNYAYLVPFVETEDEIILKTVIPSRKATHKYLKENEDESR